MRTLQMITILACSLVWFLSSMSPVWAGSWQNEYPEITVGVITEENAEDRQKRWQPFLDYMQDELGVEMTWREATDYAGVIQALKAKKIELAWFGPAAFARAWIVTDKQAVPLAAEIDKDGGFGYYGVIIVRKDSPYHNLEDLKGVKFGFADPNSTSGYQAPRFFLEKNEGLDVDSYFGSTTFSGSHESSVKMLIDGQFDAVATWWTNEKKSSMSRMENKGMIEPGQYRIIWKSPRLPSDPFTVHASAPEDMKKDITQALLHMHTKDPQAFKALMGASQRLQKVSLEDYQPVIDFVQANMK
ncbi:MAG: phosphonate ABC transporter substrate-binding protein [Desulfovermiculus sp.]|nr:phosphonate ABC transporter substrate-binding protein [Desulfovermiculus sp.]